MTVREISVATDIVRELAPDEEDLLTELTRKSSWIDRFRGSSVGFGLDFPIDAIAPYALLGVVWASGVVGGEAKAQTEERLKTLTKKAFGRITHPDVPSRSGNSISSHEELSSDVVRYIVALGMDEERARVLAEAIIARVLRQGE